ncbi:MAG: DUF4957 domain-containing protein [Dysgonamonadaceae bacterium]|jgi:hypothetical protein|nr:DUF4957 domain-containing protein [Dysgonamonadaceae bacterium]
MKHSCNTFTQGDEKGIAGQARNDSSLRMKQNQLKKGSMLLFTLVVLFFSSCVEGYKDEITWTSNVKNVTLESPEADKITIKFSADGSEQTIEWPLVPGAGGYLLSVYNMDDPNTPLPIGEENQIVDGISVKRQATEDTRYKVVIKALGNPKNNNKEAESATEKLYDNMLAVTAIIPNGTNLSNYFASNPIPASNTELCYELVAGGNYTMNGNIPIGLTSVTFRGDKTDHSKLVITDGSFVNDGAGFKLKFIDMDYANFTGTATNAVIYMNPTLNPEAPLSEGGFVVVPTTSPVAIQSCKITGLKYYLFYDNGKKYAIGTFLIKDCIIGRSVNQNAAEIRFGAGMVKDMTLTTSTFYSEQADGSNRFCQISAGHVGNVKPATETWANGSLTITNSTFYQVDKTSQSFNSNGAMRQAGDRITIQNSIFVNSFNQEAIRRFRSSNTVPVFTGGYNSYWFDGAFPTNEVTHAQGDNSGTHFEIDPQLTYLGNGEFKLSGAAQVAALTGDPRWLPAK